jgi:hypothetical protein
MIYSLSSKSSPTSTSSSSFSLPEKVVGKIRKRHLFYFFLFMATLSDLPMYCGFIVYHSYKMELYSFHKLQAAFLFTAYSLTISDWTTVLFEIKEDELIPFLLRKASLAFLSLIFFVISIMNFIYCFTSENLQEFLDSDVYETGLLLMIFIPLLLTVIMLRSGIKLSVRIQVRIYLSEDDD